MGGFKGLVLRHITSEGRERLALLVSVREWQRRASTLIVPDVSFCELISMVNSNKRVACEFTPSTTIYRRETALRVGVRPATEGAPVFVLVLTPAGRYLSTVWS